MERGKRVILALTLGMAGSAAALADNDVAGADWMPKDQIVRKLEAACYSNITGIEADDGHCEGKGVKNGKITEFEIDPHTGAFLKEEIDKD